MIDVDETIIWTINVSTRVTRGIAVVPQHPQLAFGDSYFKINVGGSTTGCKVWLVNGFAVDNELAGFWVNCHVVAWHSDDAFHQVLFRGRRVQSNESQSLSEGVGIGVRRWQPP